MKKKQINILLTALVLLNILDGDFVTPSALDFIKLVLLVFCFYLNNRKDG